MTPRFFEAFRYDDPEIAADLQAKMADLHKQREAREAELKAATRKAERTSIKGQIEQIDGMLRNGQKLLEEMLFVDEAAACQEIVLALRDSDPYPKALEMFQKNFDSDPAYAIERYASAVVGTKEIHREIEYYATTIGNLTTLAEVRPYLDGQREQQTNKLCEARLWGSSSYWSNACEMAKFESGQEYRQSCERWGWCEWLWREYDKVQRGYRERKARFNQPEASAVAGGPVVMDVAF